MRPTTFTSMDSRPWCEHYARDYAAPMAGYDRTLYQTFLAQVPMFSSCTTEQLDRIAELGDAVAAPDGSQIVKEGDDAPDFYVVPSGKAIADRGGREVAGLGAGQYFGELALFDPSPRNAT